MEQRRGEDGWGEDAFRRVKRRGLGWLADARSLPLQVCMGIAASVSLGLKQHVLFLDSTGGFTASRLYQMLRAQAQAEEEQASSPGAGPAAAPPPMLKLPWLLPADNLQRLLFSPAPPLSPWAFLGPNSSSHGWVGVALRDRHRALFFFLGRRGGLAP